MRHHRAPTHLIPVDPPPAPKRALDLYPLAQVEAIPASSGVVCHTIIYISIYAALTGQAPEYIEYNKEFVESRLPHSAVEAFIRRYSRLLDLKAEWLRRQTHYFDTLNPLPTAAFGHDSTYDFLGVSREELLNAVADRTA